MKNLLFLAALAALSLLPSNLRAADESTVATGPVFCRYVPERMDDFAWENDLVAFRAYGPALKDSKEHENSGIDCWFKRTKTPILNKWYAGEKQGVSYHKDHGEGYDGYHVGSSRGCGGTAIWQDGKTVLAGVYVGQKVVSLAPDKCVFELTYHYPAPVDVDEVKRITLEVGQRLFRSESTFTKDGKPVQLDVAVGVTTHDGRATAVGMRSTFHMEGLEGEGGTKSWVCWETIDGKGVGTGVVMAEDRPKAQVDQRFPKPDESNAFLVTATDAEGKEVHYAGFAWAGDGDITNAVDWQKYLADFKPY